MPSGTEAENRCKPEQLGTKEHGKTLERILKQEKGEVPDRKS